MAHIIRRIAMSPVTPDRAAPSFSASANADLGAAQRDMRTSYLYGAPGMLASALDWAVAGCVATWDTPQHAVWALFIGGVFIHPVGSLFARLLGAPGKHTAGNPLASLAMATTIWMIMMLALAYGVSLLRIELFFPAMLFVIGGRYLCLATLYDTRLYWLCGAALALAGYGLAELNAPIALGGFSGAAIEAVFALLLFAMARPQAGLAAMPS
jgi:hypothetical protein